MQTVTVICDYCGAEYIKKVNAMWICFLLHEEQGGKSLLGLQQAQEKRCSLPVGIHTRAGHYTAHTNEAANIAFEVENEPGAELPSTGGPGTTLLYLLGILLTGLAGAGLVMSMEKRRRAA